MPADNNHAPVQPDAQPPLPTAQAPSTVQTKSTSGMGIASLVLGILAILTSFLPIINNGSFFLALLGLVFAIVGIIATKKGKKGGRGIAIAGLVLNILSIIFVLASQSFYGAVLDEASKEIESGSKPVAATPASKTTEADQQQSTTPTEQNVSSAPEANADADTSEQGGSQTEGDAPAESESEVDYSNLAIGDSAEFKSGLSVRVDGVITGLVNYKDEPITGITVTYTNNGDGNESFNPYDWKAQDVNGVISSMTYIMDAENELSSGELTPGSTITGNIYFNGELAKALYYNNIFLSDSEVAWNLQ